MKKGKDVAMEQKQSYVQYKCNMTGFQELVDKIYGKLKSEERCGLRNELMKTPFWKLISLYDRRMMRRNTAEKSDQTTHRLVQCYDTSLQKFKFGKHLAEISVSDVHHILGLPETGLTLPKPTEDSRKPTDNPIVQKNFANEKRITRGKIMSCIEAELDKEETPGRTQNIAVLMILHLFISFLFASSGSTLGWSFVKCIADVETMNKYNWAQGVRDYLLFCLSIAKQGKAVQISGCVTLIMYWICERTTLLKEIDGRKDMTPACAKWSLPECSNRLGTMKVEEIHVRMQ